MSRWRFGSAVRAALLLLVHAAHVWAAPSEREVLGAPCALDADCGGGTLVCVKGDPELGLSGPAGGVCSLPCGSHGDCHAFDDATYCLLNRPCAPSERCGFCSEGCWAEETREGEAKCHDREDMACGRVNSDSITTGICRPTCAGDAQCGAGLYCNPSTGYCDAVPAEGLPPGSACEFGEEPACAGVCRGSTCIEMCVIGTEVGCQRSKVVSAIGAACLHGFGGSAVGDRGACARLCNCDSDCLEQEHCERWAFDESMGALGTCEPGPGIEGAPGCLDGEMDAGTEGCAQGVVVACKSDGCLGTAECLPDGTYGECRCIDVPKAGSGPSPLDADAASDAGDACADADAAGGADAAAPPPDTSDCSCNLSGRRMRVPTTAWLFALMVIGVRARRRRSPRWR